MRSRLMDDLAFEYGMLRRFGSAHPEIRKNAICRIRRIIKRQQDQRTDSLCDHDARDVFDNNKWRYRYDEDGEGCREYIIIRDASFTDQELDELTGELEIRICSPYDCTGRPFTRWIYWKRMPAGIAIVHRIGLDV